MFASLSYPVQKARMFSTIPKYGSKMTSVGTVVIIISALLSLLGIRRVNSLIIGGSVPDSSVLIYVVLPLFVLVGSVYSTIYFLSARTKFSTDAIKYSPVGILRVQKETGEVLEQNDAIGGLAGEYVGMNIQDLIPEGSDSVVINDRSYIVRRRPVTRHDEMYLFTDVTSLERRIEQLKTVAYTFRHDVASHVTVARTAAQFIEMDGYDEDVFQMLLDELCKATALLQGLSAWSDIIQGSRSEITREEIDLTEMVLDTGKSYLDVDIQGSLGFAQGNYGLVQNIFRNLSENAANYSLSRSPQIIVWRISDTIYIQDDAGGFGCVDGVFDPDFANNLFKPNQRGSTTRHGMGLGLAIVEASVQLHEWKLRYDSECGKGTLWSLTVK